MEYKQSYRNLSKHEVQFHAVVGLKLSFFNFLDTFFKEEWDLYYKEYTVEGTKRQRKASIRRDNTFSCEEDKLCFILSYLKNNPLQETHASNWGLLQPRANVWIHLLLKILLATVEKMSLVPTEDVAELKLLLKDVDVVFIDGTERTIQRPQHKEEQKWHYSGKKRRIR